MNGATPSANLGVNAAAATGSGTGTVNKQLLEPTKLLGLFEKITKTTSSIELQITINTYVSIFCYLSATRWRLLRVASLMYIIYC